MTETQANSSPTEFQPGDASPLAALTRGREYWFRYQGRSMWPYFQTGDLLVAEPVALCALRRGDCIVYRLPDCADYIVHRIVRTAPVIVTRGDARPGVDNRPIEFGWVVGRVTRRIRFGCSRRVAHSFGGVVAGNMYRWLGKLAPDRATHGGKVARLAGLILRPVGKIILRQCWVASFPNKVEHRAQMVIWRSKVIGHQGQASSKWMFAWPYCIVLDGSSIDPCDSTIR